MYNYVITKPIGRLGNHIITYINTIILHLYLHSNKHHHTNTIYIALENNNKLLKHTLHCNPQLNTIIVPSNQISNMITSSTNITYKQVTRIVNGYDIFHLSNLFINKNIQSKLCFASYMYLMNKCMNNLWSNDTYNYLNNDGMSHFINYISSNYINLDTTLVIHIKCTDNTEPDKHVYSKYNIYPNLLYLEICKKYNYDTILVITDNPQHIIIKDLLNYKSHIRVLCPSTTILNDIVFIINARNILIDNSTFTWVLSMHPFIYSYDRNSKTVFYYKDFFNKFLLDINTNPWDKAITNFCINSHIDTLNYNLTNKYIDFHNITYNYLNCSSNCNSLNNICVPRYDNTMLKCNTFFNIILFDYKSTIKIGEWIGNTTQINTLLL